MYYESIRTLLEEEFANNNFSESQKYSALDLLNKLSDNFAKISSSRPIYLVAAIAFFIFEKEDKTRSFKQLGRDFGVEAKTIALKVKEIAPFLDISNPEEVITKGLFVVAGEPQSVPPAEAQMLFMAAGTANTKVNPAIRKNIPEDFLKTKRNISNGNELQDQEMILLFKHFKPFVALLFKDKDFMEIKQFLKLLELNLYMSGYDIKNLDTEKKFGELFIYLGFEPKKGREPEKFVHLKDRFGQSEPYSLIKLGE